MSRILIVEDEESFSDPLSYLLGKEGFEVEVVDNGLDAITEFDRNGADLVLLDLQLPGLSGTEVCRQLRASTVNEDAVMDAALELRNALRPYV